MIYLYYFNIVIQSLRYLGKYVLCYNRQNKATKIDGAVVCLSFAVNMARFGNITADKSTYFFSFYLQNEMLCIRLAFPLYRPTVLIELEKRGNCDRCKKKKKKKDVKITQSSYATTLPHWVVKENRKLSKICLDIMKNDTSLAPNLQLKDALMVLRSRVIVISFLTPCHINTIDVIWEVLCKYSQ
jgi:hypothetical protein